MTLQADVLAAVLDDYQYVDGLVELTIYRPGTATTWTGVYGISYKAKQEETGGTLSLRKDVQIWHIFADTFAMEPHPGDEITDADNVTWTVCPIEGKSTTENDSLSNSALCYKVRCVRKV